MEMREFLAMLQFEVQKSFDFVEETKGVKDRDISTIHIALEKVEVDLPVTFSPKEISYKPKELKGIDPIVKRLRLPFHERTVTDKFYIPRNELKGHSIEVNIIGPNEKLDEKYATELVGRIKVVMKPVLK